jgi:hypothetical protein
LPTLARAIQGLILFSTALGVFFLLQAYQVVPADVFYILLTGWLLFAFDSVLTFIRPKVSFYLGLVLALVALTETLTQPEHYALVENGNVAATITLVLGSISQGILIALIAYYLVRHRKEDPWAWPGSESPVSDVAPAQ